MATCDLYLLPVLLEVKPVFGSDEKGEERDDDDEDNEDPMKIS